MLSHYLVIIFFFVMDACLVWLANTVPSICIAEMTCFYADFSMSSSLLENVGCGIAQKSSKQQVPKST